MRLCRNEVGRKPKRKERKVWTEAHGREGHMNPEAETGMGQPQAKDWQGWLVTPETKRETWNRFSQREPTLPTICFQTSGLLNYEKINSCCFKTPGLWYFVPAALGN